MSNKQFAFTLVINTPPTDIWISSNDSSVTKNTGLPDFINTTRTVSIEDKFYTGRKCGDMQQLIMSHADLYFVTDLINLAASAAPICDNYSPYLFSGRSFMLMDFFQDNVEFARQPISSFIISSRRFTYQENTNDIKTLVSELIGVVKYTNLNFPKHKGLSFIKQILELLIHNINDSDVHYSLVGLSLDSINFSH